MGGGRLTDHYRGRTALVSEWWFTRSAVCNPEGSSTYIGIDRAAPVGLAPGFLHLVVAVRRSHVCVRKSEGRGGGVMLEMLEMLETADPVWSSPRKDEVGDPAVFYTLSPSPRAPFPAPRPGRMNCQGPSLQGGTDKGGRWVRVAGPTLWVRPPTPQRALLSADGTHRSLGPRCGPSSWPASFPSPFPVLPLSSLSRLPSRLFHLFPRPLSLRGEGPTVHHAGGGRGRSIW